jgi:PKD repeat protein
MKFSWVSRPTWATSRAIGNRIGVMKIIERTGGVFLALALTAVFFSQPAHAWPGCTAFFSAAYPGSQTEDEGACQTCHQSSTGGGNFNGYGQDLRSNGAAGVGVACTSADIAGAFMAVELFDSDGEGTSNIDEINAHAQPGWCLESQGSSCANQGVPPAGIILDPAVANAAPIADAGGPYSGEAGTTVIQFNGAGSADSDGDALTFAWNFGDGSTATGAMPTHIYGTAGDFQVTLVVNDSQTDSDPAVAAASITAPPSNLAPTANAGGPYEGQPGLSIMFNGSLSSDPNGDALTFAWDFGDGAMATGVAPTHAFAADGTYVISLTVNDGQVDSVASTTSATVATRAANSAPTADAGGPYSGDAGLAVNFDGRASDDPDGDVLSYRWDFGDGTIEFGATPSHVYAMAGTYTVRLVVNDGEFDSQAASTEATIINRVDQSDGAALYDANCLACHGDPWSGPPVDGSLPGLRRVAGARSCNISGSIFGTSVFPNGVPEMQFLQGLLEAEIDALAEHLNSLDASGEERYVTTCAGCHGDDGRGGRVGEGILGDSAHETREAIAEESEMRYLACMPESDFVAIAGFLKGTVGDNDIDDDERHGKDGGGTIGLPFLTLLLLLGVARRRRKLLKDSQS